MESISKQKLEAILKQKLEEINSEAGKTGPGDFKLTELAVFKLGIEWVLRELEVGAFNLDRPDSDFNQDFAEKMEARMLTSRHKYGPWAKNRKYVDAIANAQKRLQLYLDSGNTEGLVDAANFLMMEFSMPIHPKAHFRAESADEAPAIVCIKEEEPESKTLTRSLLNFVGKGKLKIPKGPVNPPKRYGNKNKKRRRK